MRTEDKMTQVDLASGAFGQTNETTALELITAYAAAINGGYVVQPYVVDHIVDSSGNTVLQNTTTEKRQIISEETSKTVREQLEAVVSGNPSHNAYIQGYRIGGSPVRQKSVPPGTSKMTMWHRTALCAGR